MAQGWQAQGSNVRGLSFDALSAPRGEGSSTFAAIRSAAAPAKAATTSIADRLTTIGDTVIKLANNAGDTDATIAEKLRSLPQR